MEIRPKNNLDFMRTLLALGVLSFHAFQMIGIDYPQLPWVPAFIAISGYLITASMARSAGYLHFAWKRLLRVGPAFLLSLGLVAVLGGSAIDALSDWIFMGFRTASANPPLWSVSLEEELYFLLAVAFAFGLYRTSRRAICGLGAMFGIVVLASGLAPDIVVPLLYVASAFISGSFLYVARDRVPWLVTVGIASLVAAAWLRNTQFNNPALYALLTGPLIAYAMLTLALHTPPIFSGYKRVVGDLSLGIYVYHFPILLCLKANGTYGLQLYAATLIMTAALAFLSWHAVEKFALSKRMKSLWLINPSSQSASLRGP